MKAEKFYLYTNYKYWRDKSRGRSKSYTSKEIKAMDRKYLSNVIPHTHDYQMYMIISKVKNIASDRARRNASEIRGNLTEI